MKVKWVFVLLVKKKKVCLKIFSKLFALISGGSLAIVP